MSDTNILDPLFIYPINQAGIDFNPNKARFIMSENPAPRGSVVMLGGIKRTIKFSEDLVLLVFPNSGKLRISRNFLIIDSGGAVEKFVNDLGFANRQSFVRCTFNKFTYDQSAAKRKLILHHFYDDSIMPPV